MAKAKTNPTKSAPMGQPGVSHAPQHLLDPDALPDRYVLTVDGSCMDPEIPDGAKVICDKTAKPKAGDLAVFFLRPECIPAGEHQAQLKRLVLGVAPFVKLPWRDHPDSNVRAIVILEMSNPRRQFHYRCDQLLAIHKCIGLVPAKATYDAKARTYMLPASALDERGSGTNGRTK
jgi:hypothetical protein